MPSPTSANEVQILTGYDDRGSEALVERIVENEAGFQVELKLGDGRPAWSRLTPEESEQLELHEGQILPIGVGPTLSG
ncbi:MAG TPA: TOBE domain-containing protein [Solirubrobacteraceae bacterium]